MKSINKRGQALGGLSGNMIALVVGIIILVLGVVILQELRDVKTIAGVNSDSFVNESSNLSASGTDALACNSNAGASCSIATVVNQSDQIEITVVGNFTLSANGCELTTNDTKTNNLFNRSDVNVTYSCNFGGEAFASANASMVAVGNFSDFVPIIVIALAASIVIGLILVGFVFSGRNR